MKTKIKLVIALLVFTIAQSALAEEWKQPPAVTGVTLEKTEDGVTVRWTAVTGVEIQYYRVYHSTESILENDGIYDDFEITDGPATSLMIKLPPHITELYAAVIAVGTDNLESEFFIEEGYINLAPESELQPESQEKATKRNTQDGLLHMLSAKALSPTEVQLQFSVPPTVDPKDAPQNLRITDQKGFMLQIKSISILQTVMTINTVEQEKDTVYRVDMSDAFHGIDDEPLDEIDRTYLFPSAGQRETAPQPDAPKPRDPNNPPDVQNLTFRHEPQQDGAYTVTIEWLTDNTPNDLLYHVVYQTRDGGRTFGPPGILPIDIRGVRIPNLTAGPFGIVVQTVNVFGFASKGIFEQVFLPYYVPGYGFYGANLTAEGGTGARQLEEAHEQIQVIPMKIPEETEGDAATLLPIDAQSGEVQSLRPAPDAEPRMGAEKVAVIGISSLVILGIALTVMRRLRSTNP